MANRGFRPSNGSARLVSGSEPSAVFSKPSGRRCPSTNVRTSVSDTLLFSARPTTSAMSAHVRRPSTVLSTR